MDWPPAPIRGRAGGAFTKEKQVIDDAALRDMPLAEMYRRLLDPHDPDRARLRLLREYRGVERSVETLEAALVERRKEAEAIAKALNAAARA